MFLLYFDSDKDPLHGYKAMHIKISKTFQCIMYVQEVTVVNLLIPNTMNDDFAMRRDFNCTWFLMPESALSCHGFLV